MKPGVVEWNKTYCPRSVLLDLGQMNFGASHWYHFLHPPGIPCMFLSQRPGIASNQDPLHQCRI